MGRIFQVDGPVYKFLSRFVDLVVLNFWFLLCSIPIITIGASLSAAYTVGMRMVKDEEDSITKDYFAAFASNWKQSTILWIITIVVSYFVYLDFEVFKAMDKGSVLLLLIGGLTGFYFFFSLLYAIPLSTRYKNTIYMILRNSMQISCRYFGKTVFLVFLIVMELVMFWYDKVTLFFAVLIGPSFIIFTKSWLCRTIFEDIERKQKE
ncbi:YesL family protein [Anaerosacchariphilus polymeriproducens]|uniref:DUF624 domain-containing protein n=1 Tax=Anaerosacchariphilus polymeriproducens TaxID=1812858 RepID=A0A371AW58_9FIRM|nr:YesL family protein [Anaerosacchariphilus polymeriproducens]RDU23808.1 DUF624 domain-containing protein [Anaerosacchariphilus polymeriproducens]